MSRLNQQDLWAGVLFVLVGLGAVVLGKDLTIGTPMEMGEGFVPRAMGMALIALGGLIMGVAWFRPGEKLDQMAWRPLTFVTAAVFLFTTVEWLGLGIAIALSVIAANWAGKPLDARILTALIVVLSAGVVLIFVWGLGLPLPVLPRVSD